MYNAGHPYLLYIFIMYSIVFLIRSKTKNEFLLLFTIFCFLEAKNSWENSIISIIKNPINIRVIDIAMLILIVFMLKSFIERKFFFNKILKTSKFLYFFILLVIIYTMFGVWHFGYAGIAEFRLLFFYIIIVIFIFSNVRKYEILRLIKKISEYLIPLILLIPINIILTGNASISSDNRALGAFIYETITMGYIAGYFYWSYIDKKFKLFLWFLPIFIVFSIWANVRTVWAIIIAAFLFKFLLEKGKLKAFFFVIVLIFLINSMDVININYLENRTKAFTNISEDATGNWRLYIWNTVIRNATFWGEGIGARFKVYADVIGYAAENGAHNGFIRILYNLGYLGVFITFILFISFIIKFLKAMKKKSSLPSYNMIYRLSLMSVFSLILYMMGYSPDLLSWIFITFGLVYSLKEKINSNNTRILHA